MTISLWHFFDFKKICGIVKTERNTKPKWKAVNKNDKTSSAGKSPHRDVGDNKNLKPKGVRQNDKHQS